jgi:Dyp-type peroxidase family
MTAASTLLTDDDRADIQGFITSGYGHLPVAAYLFVRVPDGARVTQWIQTLERTISSSRPWPVAADGEKERPASAVNVAFTAQGLLACGLPQQVVCTFPPEFQEDIATVHRSRILGDTEASDPVRWDLGGPDKAFHAVVLIHADSDAVLERSCREQRALMEQAGVMELPGSVQYGYRPSHDREHFGFHDGISQPLIAGIAERGVPTGEFILGYANHYGVIPPTPVVPGRLDRDGLLPALANPYYSSSGLRDLGRHGTYVVYRKLRQHVGTFWDFMKQEAVRAGRGADVEYMIWLASKCVGRWPSGAPLALAPARDDPSLADRDDFMYASDPNGMACPLGAHVRRANPRDVIKPYEPEQSLHMSEAHRLIRRGRAYGPPLFDAAALNNASSHDARALLDLQDDGQPRGVHFWCVNASIRSQFEFVQQTWCNNPRFGGLRNNKDPLVGDHGGTGQPATQMTVPSPSGSRQTSALPRFVTVSGGAYLFMPSLTALRFLARLEYGASSSQAS